ncbi:YchJ family protein [Aliiglaciecola sp. M165]|uniref:YchJ family protein n=1 Tax=Aliiglaciecola sp. M165 TaxID=2593649 RepID=UPI00117E5514|nr:YchJ family protein [Aliiglaciecola sp. M165]TRY30049.1 zinc chelation protein SecC [Aliiglaciecola sp. M165]
MNATSECPCKSGQLFDLCCKPFLDRTTYPPSPEQLMRSRYSAYQQSDYQYIYDTYAKEQQKAISVKEISKSSAGSSWLNLIIINTFETDKVEFKAIYKEAKQFFMLHENSTFLKEDGFWRYRDGIIFEDSGLLKPGRNDNCPCGSGKKFKKCCGR